ncbi:MAG: hypothetical protein Dasosvirus2_33 [Dasosvirus sp.]|uniref:Late transcription factor VLTF3-like protein n=1 Tax=Dasosvirus sp. TaxID=2487764 RepID=A0A3G4ZRC2_9VIRU|nr:MAG: hypothetical protein Dasosvirus2_33 [Dasosvirus sp.]
MSVEYKYKPEKHKFLTNTKTIDEVHNEHVNNFRQDHDLLPKKKKSLKDLEKELRKQNTCNASNNMNTENLKKRISLRNSIQKLKKEIDDIENFDKEMNYYGKTYDVVYDYYDLTNGMLYNNKFNNQSNNKSDTQNNFELDKYQEEPDEKNFQETARISISKELLEITNGNKKRKLKRTVRKRTKNEEIITDKTVMSYFLNPNDLKAEEDEKKNRASLQNEYLLMIDKEYACTKSKINPIRKCKKCNVDMIVVHNEAIMTCPNPKCGEFEYIVIESELPSHNETFNEKPKYPYKRVGHCIEKLNQFLCKGTANIPQEVFNVLEEEIKKHSFNKNTITINFLEKMLKKHKLSDYYENIMYIYSRITGTPPQTITRDEYELILGMFIEASDIYEKKYKPKDRHNFLKYTFVLHKIFLILKKPHHAKHFKLLKSPTKLKQQERIWKLICMDKDWDYYAD